MKKINKTHYTKLIDAIVPTYGLEGDNRCTIIYPDGASVTEPISVEKFMKLWLRIMRIDIGSHRMWAQDILDRRNSSPVVIHENMVFIPIKMRKPIGAKDGACGYVRMGSMEEINKGEIVLKSGTVLPCLYTRETVMKRIREANHLQLQYEKEKKIYDEIYKRANVNALI